MASSSSAEALGDDANDTEIFCGLSPHDYLAVKFFMISIVGTLIGLFGLFGNFTTIIVLTRPSMRNPNNLFLTALAVFDSCLLVTAFFIYAMEYIIEYTEAFDLYVAWLTYLRFAYALSHISQTGSVYITVSVTIERYMAVCYPRRAKRMCSSRGSALAILSVSSFAVIFNATKFFELEVTRNPPCGDGVNWQSYILRPSNLALNPLYGEIYSLWLTNSVMVFFPFICLLTLNSIIAYTIRKSLRRMKFSDKYQSVLQTLSIERCLQALKRHENRMDGRSELKNKSREASLVLVVSNFLPSSTTLKIIVAIFLICNFWGFVLTLVEQIVDRSVLDENYHAFYTFSREAINFLAIINSSINFVIYIIFGKDFRRELVVVYGCGLRPLSLRLPVHDKFSIWRHISRSLSRRPTTRRDKTTSDLAGSDQPLIATQLPRVPFNHRPDAFSPMSPPTSPAAEDEESPPPDPSTARLLPTLQVVVAKGGLAQSQLVFEDL